MPQELRRKTTDADLIDMRNVFDMIDEDGSETIDAMELRRVVDLMGDAVSDEDLVSVCACNKRNTVDRTRVV